MFQSLQNRILNPKNKLKLNTTYKNALAQTQNDFETLTALKNWISGTLDYGLESEDWTTDWILLDFRVSRFAYVRLCDTPGLDRP